MSKQPSRQMPSSVHGVRGEESAQHTNLENRALRWRSFRLLLDLLRPVRAQVAEVALSAIIATLAKVAVPALVGLGIDAGFRAINRQDSWLPFVAIAAMTLLAALAAGLFEGHARAVTPRFAQKMLLDLRRRLFAHAQALSMQFHESYTSGRLISRQTSDIEAIREFVGAGFNQFVSSLLFLIGVVVSILLLDLPSGLILFAGVLPTALIGWWFIRNSRNGFRKVRVASSSLIATFVESMIGIRAVQTFRAQAMRLSQFESCAEDYRRSISRVILVFGIAHSGLAAVSALVAASLMFYDGSRVLAGTLPVGVLLSAVLYTKQFFEPMMDLMLFTNQLQNATSALEKISGVLQEEPTVPEPHRPVAVAASKGRLELDRVSFGYGGSAFRLGEINLDIPAGQVVAIVGSTGAGKTTLVKLMARLMDPDSGQVRLDGNDLRNIADADLRRAVVMVTQESYLFSGTVAANIGLGRPGASREDIERAALSVGADGFIRALPDGYETDVRSRGGRLSSGQRQLVSFARAFLADPQVLILDEATSSLDLPSERLVQRGLQTLLRGRTAIIIAHRLSTVAIADRVLVVDDGQISEDGPPLELIDAGSGHFASLHRQWEQSMGGFTPS